MLFAAQLNSHEANAANEEQTCDRKSALQGISTDPPCESKHRDFRSVLNNGQKDYRPVVISAK